MPPFFSFTELTDHYGAGGEYRPQRRRALLVSARGDWKISDEAAAEYFENLSPSRFAKLQEIVRHAARCMGYGSINEGGRSWLRVERQVVDDLLCSETDIDEIEMGWE